MPVFVFGEQVNQSWVGDVCAVNASTWIGISCVAGLVTRIDLSQVHVTGGTLPAELAGLRTLSVLNMSKCGLTGSSPSICFTEHMAICLARAKMQPDG